MAEKMTNSFRHVLRALERNPDRWTPGMRLPNGHGHCTDRLHASGATLQQMREQDLIQYERTLSTAFMATASPTWAAAPSTRPAMDERTVRTDAAAIRAGE